VELLLHLLLRDEEEWTSSRSLHGHRAMHRCFISSHHPYWGRRGRDIQQQCIARYTL